MGHVLTDAAGSANLMRAEFDAPEEGTDGAFSIGK